jgi:hypothetical protein
MIFLRSLDEIKSKFVRNLHNACAGKIAANEQIPKLLYSYVCPMDGYVLNMVK